MYYSVYKVRGTFYSAVLSQQNIETYLNYINYRHLPFNSAGSHRKRLKLQNGAEKTFSILSVFLNLLILKLLRLSQERKVP